MRKLVFALLLAVVSAGCATVEMSSVGSMKNGDRLLSIQNDGYELLWFIPLWSGLLEWDAEDNDVDCSPALFRNHADTQHLYEMAHRIAERENCELVDVTFIDKYAGLDFRNLYGLIKANDVLISAVLRPRK